MQTNKQNLKLFGLPESDQEKALGVQTLVTRSINEELGVDIDQHMIGGAYRLPSRTKPRPILLQCANTKSKDTILSRFREKRKAGHELSFRVSTYLPEQNMPIQLVL